MKFPLYTIDIDLLDNETGLDAISLVTNPAVEIDFLCFDDNNKKEKLSFSDDKHIITGVAILADTPIYRNTNGYEYFVTFTREAIAKMVEKYAKQGLLNSVNLQHDDDQKVDDLVMVESYIKDSQRGIVPVEFQDIPDGSWIVSYKVLNEDLWQEIKNGKQLNGFSVQGIFDLEEVGKLDVEFASKPLAQMTLVERIENAIDMHYECALDYNSPIDEEGNDVLTYRNVVVVAYGMSQAGNDVIRAFQVEGNTISGAVPTWRLFRVDRISKLTPKRKSDRYMLPFPLYDFTTDKSMLQVYKIATYTDSQIKRAEEGEGNVDYQLKQS